MNIKKSILIVLSSIAVLYCSTNFRLSDETINALTLYFLIPLLTGRVLLKKEWANLGFSTGNWKIGSLTAICGGLIAAIIVFLAVRYSPSVAQYYSGRILDLKLILKTITYMFAWEFFLRGYLLFGLQEYIGFNKANIIQTLIFFISHWNKTPIEFYSTLITGMIFGYIAMKSRSFWPVMIIHTVIYLSVVYFANP